MTRNKKLRPDRRSSEREDDCGKVSQSIITRKYLVLPFWTRTYLSCTKDAKETEKSTVGTRTLLMLTPPPCTVFRDSPFDGKICVSARNDTMSKEAARRCLGNVTVGTPSRISNNCVSVSSFNNPIVSLAKRRSEAFTANSYASVPCTKVVISFPKRFCKLRNSGRSRFSNNSRLTSSSGIKVNILI